MAHSKQNGGIFKKLLNSLNLARGDSGTGSQPSNTPLSLLLKTSKNRALTDIARWRSALASAERAENPRRALLQSIYAEVKLDAHLAGLWNSRKRKSLSARYSVYNAANEKDEALTWLLKAPWFSDFLNLCLEALADGHALIQIDSVLPLVNGAGGIQSVTRVPPEHVSPEDGLLLKRPTDQTGIRYREFPDFEGWIIETPDEQGLGFYNECSPHVLYKRFAFASWSEYGELFGMPLRKASTNVRDPQMLRQMEDMLIRMGSAAYAIIDQSEDLEFIQTTQGKGEVFEGLMNFCNNELSKLLQGAVIGGESQGGSRSKEEVGERIFNSIVEGDKEYLENIVNTRLIPVLIQHGYPLEGCTWAFEEQKDLSQLWTQTQGVLQYFEVEEQFIIDTFGIPVTAKREKVEPQNQEKKKDKENAD